MDNKNFDLTNRCYEALLDLKSIFPSWSDLQGNFHYHWKKILNSSINFKDSENKVLKTYLTLLEPLVNYDPEGLESNAALELVRNLDKYRKNEDKEFEPYLLEEVLNRDTPAIKPPQRFPRAPSVKKKPPPSPKIVLNEEVGTPHTYGTRRSKWLSEADGDSDKKPMLAKFGMGRHLKKGFFSDYVWEFNDFEQKVF
ncbi:uncharacterized protein TA07235 [Theileria annulata]|uniref:Uncharacterized protein n=1 Tax=Theileria annulata TaxID=5874 RepID=Q4UA96_THEAN|nr:uncharacterized protein TA07235 [Theileria annulata]CAI76257.1 hypothetical protein TA07235 [Theileria annulata]|eukprot:XP_952881.1 hypothetical protein TA07235 [Theileria annulata]